MFARKRDGERRYVRKIKSSQVKSFGGWEEESSAKPRRPLLVQPLLVELVRSKRAISNHTHAPATIILDTRFCDIQLRCFPPLRPIDVNKLPS